MLPAQAQGQVPVATLLENLDLSAYYDALHENGFDTWDALQDITEADLQRMNFKLGHRRKLQREIDTARLRTLAAQRNRRISHLHSGIRGGQVPSVAVKTRIGLSKRGRFAHEPRPDDDAPTPPKTAYQNFGVHVEQGLQSQGASYIAIARETSEQWAALSIQSRLQDWLKPAAKAIAEYQTARREYKNSESYQSYQIYLEEYDRVHESRYSDLAQERFEATANSKRNRKYTVLHVVDKTSLLTAEDEYAIDVDKALVEFHRSVEGQTYEYKKPQQDATVLAVTAFFNGTGQRFYLWDQEEAYASIEEAFDPAVEADPWCLMDLLAIAAIGACCDADCFPQFLHAQFASSCLHILKTCTVRKDLRAMRVFIALSFYCTLENPHRSRMLSGISLYIGRLELQVRCSTQKAHPAEENDWRKVFRSIVFVESWLHYGLGFPLRLTDEDIKTGNDDIYGTNTSLEDIIQHQVSTIGMLAVRIAVDTKSRNTPVVEEIKNHMENLEVWYRQLPVMMRMSTLHSQQADIFSQFQRRSVLLVHLMCLSAVTILHRPLLITIARERLSGIWEIEGNREDTRLYQDYCFIAARQASRIAGLLREDRTLPRRCWIAIFQSFSACCILLFSASQKLLYEPFAEFEQDLIYADNFLKLLAWCANTESVAQKCLDIVTPTFDELKKISSSYWIGTDPGRDWDYGSGLSSGQSGKHTRDHSCSLNESIFGGLRDMPPPPRPPPRMLTPQLPLTGANAEYMQQARDKIKTIVQRIANILLDPYMTIYGATNRDQMFPDRV